MRGPEEWPSSGSNPADRIRLTGPAATNFLFSGKVLPLSRSDAVQQQEGWISDSIRLLVDKPAGLREVVQDCSGIRDVLAVSGPHICGGTR
jgi:hypothetical protein